MCGAAVKSYTVEMHFFSFLSKMFREPAFATPTCSASRGFGVSSLKDCGHHGMLALIRLLIARRQFVKDCTAAGPFGSAEMKS